MSHGKYVLKVRHTMLKQILYCSMTTVLCRFMKSCLPQVIAYIYETLAIPSLYQVPERHCMQHYIKNTYKK
jgi:hypothetical protein